MTNSYQMEGPSKLVDRHKVMLISDSKLLQEWTETHLQLLSQGRNWMAEYK